jgi:hypothetical protein
VSLVRDSAGNGITLPVSTAWMYMADDQAYSQIPAYWPKIVIAAIAEA